MTRLAIVPILTLACCGCSGADYTGIENAGPFDHLLYREKTSPPGVANLSPTEIRIQQGIAIKARISAVDSAGQPLPVLDLQSANSSIFVSERGPSLGNYVFYGVEPGATELLVTSRGYLEASIPVDVVETGEGLEPAP